MGGIYGAHLWGASIGCDWGVHPWGASLGGIYGAHLMRHIYGV